MGGPHHILLVSSHLFISQYRTSRGGVALVVKNLPANAGDARDAGSTPELGRSPGERNGKWKIPWTEEPGGL